MATPKTESYLLNNVFQDNQPDGSITASDMRDLIASVRYLQPLGWEFRYDSNYTEGSPMPLADSIPQKITFSDNINEDLRYPSTFYELWNTTTQKLDIAPAANPTAFVNGFGIVRFSCLASSPAAQNTHLEFYVDTGNNPVFDANYPSEPGYTGTSNIIYEDSATFAKGNNITQSFNWVVPFFGGADFVANGATFVIRSHGGAASVWRFAVTAGAIFVPNPAGEG